MRTRRLCEKKPSGRLHVPPDVCEDFKEGGERREMLQMALLECLADLGTSRANYKKVKAWFFSQNSILLKQPYIVHVSDVVLKDW